MVPIGIGFMDYIKWNLDWINRRKMGDTFMTNAIERKTIYAS